jgi:hypothetical protein
MLLSPFVLLSFSVGSGGFRRPGSASLLTSCSCSAASRKDLKINKTRREIGRVSHQRIDGLTNSLEEK